jgi:hypothetical protein
VLGCAVPTERGGILPVVSTPLHRLTDEEVERLYESLAANASPGIAMLQQEMANRSLNRQGDSMVAHAATTERLTRQVVRLTVILTVLTVINVAAVLVGVLK